MCAVSNQCCKVWLKMMISMKSLDAGSQLWVSLREDEHATTFRPDEADIFVIDISQIVGVLPEPQITEKDRKVVYVFPGSLAVFEKA